MSQRNSATGEHEALLNTSEVVPSSSRNYSTLDNADHYQRPASREETQLVADKEKLIGHDQSYDSERSYSSVEELGDGDVSLYERKCLLVNREIDLMGMGRYQWSIWVLCGAGYMIDLMWAQAVSTFHMCNACETLLTLFIPSSLDLSCPQCSKNLVSVLIRQVNSRRPFQSDLQPARSSGVS